MSSDKNNSNINNGKIDNRSYDENPDDKVALQKAIETLPVKDYSDYEINIESKAHYEDALFKDDQSLTEAAATINKTEELGTTTKRPKDDTTPSQQSKSTVSTQQDYQRFLSTNDQASNLESKTFELHLTGINQSPPNPSYKAETVITPPATSALPLPDSLTNKHPIPVSATVEPSSAESSSTESSFSEQSSYHETEPEHRDQKQPPSTVNNLFKKIQAKAIEKIGEHKDQVDEYLGRTLPTREMPLNFQIGKTKPAKEFDELYSASKMTELLQAKVIKNPILSRCQQALSNLVKADLSSHKKYAVYAVAELPITERSRSLISSLERKPCFNDDPARAESVQLCLQNLRQLITGYKQLYSQLYESSNLIYGPQRDKANHYAFRLIDLLCLEQHLCIACHQKTAAVNIHTFNNVYLGLALYEPEQLSLPREVNSLDGTSTINALLINYHLLGALQTTQLSARFHKILRAYLLEHQPFINILPLEHDQRLEQPTWCIEHNQAGYAVLVDYLRVKSEGDLPCLYVQVQGFFNAIKADYYTVLNQLGAQATDKPLSNCLEAVSPREKLVMLSMLNDSVTKIECNTHPAIFSRYENQNSHVYSPLTNAVAQLRFDSYQQLTNKTKKTDQPEKPIASQSRWSVAHEDSYSLYLQTDELKSKLMLDIGHVIMLGKTSSNTDSNISNEEQTSTDYRIGHIVSLYRDSAGKIFIHLQKYGEDSAAIQIKSKQHSIDAIISDAGDSKYLLLEKAPYLKAGTVLSIEFDNQLKSTVTVDQLVTVTAQCYVYRLC